VAHQLVAAAAPAVPAHPPAEVLERPTVHRQEHHLLAQSYDGGRSALRHEQGTFAEVDQVWDVLSAQELLG